MRRVLILLLAGILLLTALSGCAQQDAEEETDPRLYALDAYAPETVVMTIDGTEVHWNEFAFWLCTTAKDLANADGAEAIENWNAVYDKETGETYSDVLMRTVLEKLRQFHSIAGKAKSYGLELGADGEAYVEQSLSESLQLIQASTDEDRAKRMRIYYLDQDVLRYQAEISYYYLLLYQEMFGADGEKLSEDELNDYAAQNGYMTAKHILLSTVDENNNPLPDEEKQQKFERAERIIARLSEIEDPAERLQEFDRYAGEYNEDPGAAAYPNGYCFRSGQMVAEFETGCAALAPYAVSPEPVESAYGYHVIIRLPTAGTDVLDYNSDGTPYLLQSDAAQSLYTQMVHAWMDDAKVEWKPEFENLDVQALFTKPETFWEKVDFLHWFH